MREDTWWGSAAASGLRLIDALLLAWSAADGGLLLWSNVATLSNTKQQQKSALYATTSTAKLRILSSSHSVQRELVAQ